MDVSARPKQARLEDLEDLEAVEDAEPSGNGSVGSGAFEDFDTFYRAFAPRLRGFSRRFALPPHMLEDVVQETLLRAYRARVHREDVSDHWPWLSVVARNVSIDIRRRQVFRDERLFSSEDDLEEIDLDLVCSEELVGDPEAHLASSRQRDGIADALTAVCDRHRRLLILKHVEGRRYVDIAEAEGITVDALKSVLARARDSFKNHYEAIVKERGLAALLPIWLPLGQRIRALRDRVATSEAFAASPAAGSALQGLMNSVAAATVVGAMSVGGAFAAPEPGPSADGTAVPAPVMIDVEEASTVAVDSSPVFETAVSLQEEATVDDVPADASVGVEEEPSEPSPPSGDPSEPSLEPPVVEAHEEGAEVAGAGNHQVTVAPEPERTGDGEGGTRDEINLLEQESDYDGDGETDGSASAPVGVNCPEPGDRESIEEPVCAAVDAYDEGAEALAA